MVNKKPLVYLSGPMAGLTYEEALNGWRRTAADHLMNHGIIGINPGRGKDHKLPKELRLAKQGYEHTLITSAKGITTRDLFDLKRSEFMLLNLTGAKAVGIGSMIEIGWAHAFNVPIILVMEKEGNIHEHCIVDTCAAVRTDSLDDALEYIVQCIELDCLYTY